MSDWRLARSLEQLLHQVNVTFPGRDKSWDGTIGDSAHSARKSDHNPASDNLVHALDITNDPQHGLVSQKLAEALKRSGDRRLSYIISNGKIWNPKISNDWRTYTGSNPHDHHVHVSVIDGPLEDSTAPWEIGISPEAVEVRPSAPPVPKAIRRGESDPYRVEAVWQALRLSEKGFGPVLEAAVKAYQREHGLAVDGIVGPVTRKHLNISEV